MDTKVVLCLKLYLKESFELKANAMRTDKSSLELRGVFKHKVCQQHFEQCTRASGGSPAVLLSLKGKNWAVQLYSDIAVVRSCDSNAVFCAHRNVSSLPKVIKLPLQCVLTLGWNYDTDENKGGAGSCRGGYPRNRQLLPNAESPLHRQPAFFVVMATWLLLAKMVSFIAVVYSLN